MFPDQNFVHIPHLPPVCYILLQEQQLLLHRLNNIWWTARLARGYLNPQAIVRPRPPPPPKKKTGHIVDFTTQDDKYCWRRITKLVKNLLLFSYTFRSLLCIFYTKCLGGPHYGLVVCPSRFCCTGTIDGLVWYLVWRLCHSARSQNRTLQCNMSGHNKMTHEEIREVDIEVLRSDGQSGNCWSPNFFLWNAYHWWPLLGVKISWLYVLSYSGQFRLDRFRTC